MNASLKELPLHERIKLVEDLWDSIAADRQVLNLTPEQKAELDRRLDAFALDGNRGKKVEEVISGFRRSSNARCSDSF